MNKTQLTEVQISNLREAGLIKETEYAYRAGDLIVAEDPVTGSRRVIGQSTVLSENNKRVLKG